MRSFIRLTARSTGRLAAAGGADEGGDLTLADRQLGLRSVGGEIRWGYGSIPTMMSTPEFRGVVLLQRGAEDLMAMAAGTTGTEAAGDCTPSTRFQIASVSKQFTAAAVLLLADRQLLSVDDPVHRWLDGCPANWSSMTVRHLLTHTAGLVHWLQLPDLDLTAPIAADEELRVFADAPLLGPPGERFSYSSPGYVLLAWIVERAAGQSYASFLGREVFGPLGMDATFAGNGGGRPGLAAGHRAGQRVPSFELDTVGMGAGDVWSTVGDLARWDRALASGQFLADASRQAMLTVRAPIADPGDGLVRTEGYGYGWFIGRASGGRRLIYHTGKNDGFVAVNAWFPEDDVRLVVFSNEETTDLMAIIRQATATAFPRSAT
jgi:CubicO group peptidase (beta-lactamase class C family)